MSDVYTYNLSQMTETNEFEFKGKKFKVICSHQNHPYHPSLWSHMDEVKTRQEFWTIEPGDLVFDVGADFGSYTLSALAAGAEFVMAWSPPFKLPDTPLEAQTLQLSLKANDWESRAAVFFTGLWSKEGWMAAFDGPRPAQVFDTKEEATAAITGQSGHVSVFPVKTLDSVVTPAFMSLSDSNEFSKRSWLKIDTEGCELAILQGGVNLIKQLRPKIILEHHYHIDPDCETKCDSFLADLGYVTNGRRQHHSVAHSLYSYPAR